MRSILVNILKNDRFLTDLGLKLEQEHKQIFSRSTLTDRVKGSSIQLGISSQQAQIPEDH
jgi:hypothetical protein